MSREKQERAARRVLGRHVEAAGYAFGKPMKPPGKKPAPRIALGFRSCKDGSLLIYADLPAAERWHDGEPIRIEPHRVRAALAACGDALAKTPRAH